MCVELYRSVIDVLHVWETWEPRVSWVESPQKKPKKESKPRPTGVCACVKKPRCH